MIPAIAIIGGGISGTFVVLNCLRVAKTPLRILWFDKDGLFCKGLAYSTKEEVHLLNVRASNMSVFADEPAHFVNWLKMNEQPYSAGDFVPRRVYGNYVLDTFHALQAKCTLVEVIQKSEEVLSVTKSTHSFSVFARQMHEASNVVLAVGNFLPRHPRSISQEFQTSPQYFRNAYEEQMLNEGVLSKETITIIGAGLTMIDVILAIKQKNYKGRIFSISPHGYLPQSHAEPAPTIESFIESGRTYTLLQVFELVKQQLRKARAEHKSPYSVIDALRPHVQQLWMNFSAADQLRFLRHLRHKWGVARHRAPARSIEAIAGWIADGALQVYKGRIYQIETTDTGFTLLYRNGKGEEHAMETNIIINCTGPEPDFAKVDSSLVKQLIDSGLIERHLLSYGLKASISGELSAGLFTIGPPLKGILWESTAVPEIRVQAAALAEKLF